MRKYRVRLWTPKPDSQQESRAASHPSHLSIRGQSRVTSYTARPSLRQDHQDLVHASLFITSKPDRASKYAIKTSKSVSQDGEENSRSAPPPYPAGTDSGSRCSTPWLSPVIGLDEIAPIWPVALAYARWGNILV
jgi:hypothetical protein